jgi:bifunctional DNA-binding transcriptional regulator/antitoxin component of YhaV-PrlF toxin-antitoxin module
MKTIISSKGQVVLPAIFREQDAIEPGQEFEIQRIDSGEYLLTRTKGPRNQGVVRLLLACPLKDWFQPANRTETTEHLSVPKLG